MEAVKFKNWESIFSYSLKKLKNESHHLSESQLAKKINIPRATLNRLFNSDYSKPQVDTFIKIIVGAGLDKYLKTALNNFDSGFGNSIYEAMKIGLTQKHIQMTSQELEDALEDPTLFICYILSKSSSGITKMQLTNVLGQKGLSAAEKLQQYKLVKINEGKVVATSEGNLLRSFSHIKVHLPTYAKYYKKEHVGKSRNYVHTLTEGLSKEGLKQLHLAHKEFHNKIQTIIRNPQYQGAIPAFSVAFCDSFTTKDFDALGGLK